MYENITSFWHIDECPSLPLDCPNNCGHEEIQHKDLSDLKKEWPLEPVKCPFFEAGCKQEIPQKELVAHIKANTERHLELMMINTQCQLQTMTLTAKATQDQLEEVKKESQVTKVNFLNSLSRSMA